VTKSDPTEIYVDVETLRLSDEVEGGWKNIKDFGLAVAVTWDEPNGFREWFELQAAALVEELQRYDRIVTFNGDRFDFTVLSAYVPVAGLRTRSFDLLTDLTKRLGHRVRLESVASATLGTAKGGTGLDAVRWWREGKKDKVVEYCQQDVKLMVDLVAYARKNGHVKVDSRGVSKETPVTW
jgi:DEAD/DEAH box helicase domain-containing protein